MAEVQVLSFYQVLWYFIVYSFLGWCCEVVFCSVNTGMFVNRGFLNGPYCPIYGFGAVIIVVCLEPLRENLLLLFLASAVLCSLLELVAGFLLKKLFHTTWWDYSDQPFNIGGYICLKFSLLWGLACLLLVRVIHPGVYDLVTMIPSSLGGVLLGIIYAGLLADLALTVVTVAKLNRDLQEITWLSEEMRKPSNALAKTLGNSAISVAGKIEVKLEEVSDSEAAQRLEELLKRRTRIRGRLLDAFPKMKSERHHDALEKLRERSDKRNNESEHKSHN